MAHSTSLPGRGQSVSSTTEQSFARRLAIAALPAVLLLGVLAGPATAARPVPTATATVSNRLCDFLVGYNWTKFKGRDLTAVLGLYDRTASGDVLIQEQSVEDQIGRTGSFAFGVSLEANVFPEGRTLVARGELMDRKSQPVADSADESEGLNSTCG